MEQHHFPLQNNSVPNPEFLPERMPSSGAERLSPEPRFDCYRQLAADIQDANALLGLDLDPGIAEACRLFFENFQ